MKTNEELLAENAAIRLQLETLYNGDIYQPDQAQLPVAVENLFLKNVLNFERRFKDCVPVKVADMIGNPSLPRPEEIERHEAAEYLQMAIHVFEAHGIDFLYEDHHDPFDVYTYIIDELMEEMVDDMRSTGMHLVFCYDDGSEDDEHEF